MSTDLPGKFSRGLDLTGEGRGGGVDSIFESAGSLPLKSSQLSPVSSDIDEAVGGVSAGEYLQVYRECFSIPAFKVKIWQIFTFTKQTGTPDLNGKERREYIRNYKMDL